MHMHMRRFFRFGTVEPDAITFDVRISQFSNVVGTGDWSADILVRLGAMINPKAHRRIRMSALRKNVRCAQADRGCVSVLDGAR